MKGGNLTPISGVAPRTPRPTSTVTRRARVTVPVGYILVGSQALSGSTSYLYFRPILVLENTASTSTFTIGNFLTPKKMVLVKSSPALAFSSK